MQMRHGLPRCWPIIDPDIECIWLELCLHIRLRAIQQRQQIGSFLCRQIKKGGNMPLRNHQCVSGGNGKAIADHDAMFALVAYPCGVLSVNDPAEWADAGIYL